MTRSGMWMPGTLERIQRAVLADASGPTPTRMKHFSVQPQIADLLMKVLEHRHVEAVLALHELRAGGDLLAEMEARKS
jgi:hypothetical protein